MAVNNHKVYQNQPVNWRRNLLVLWGGVFLTCASYTMIVPFLPLYLLQELGVSPTSVNMWTGIIFSITFLGSAIMAPYWGALADKVGQKRMVVRAGFGLSLCYCLAALASTPTQLFLVRALTGVISGFVPAAMALCSATLPAERLGWGMGWMQAAVASGSVIGPLIGGYVSEWFSMHFSFYVAAVALAAATIGIMFFVQDVFKNESNKHQNDGGVIHDLLLAVNNKNLLYIMVLFFLVQSCLMLIQPLLTIYVRDLMGGMEGAVKASGVVFSLAGIAGIMAAPFWGKLGQKIGFTKTLFFVMFCAGFTNLFQVFVDNIWQFGFVQFVFGLFLAGAAPNINAGIVKTTDPLVRGKAFGLVTSAQQFGGVMGPLLGGFLGSFLATKYILVFTGIILMTAGLHIYFTKVKSKQGNSTW
ncbi:MAG TPA: MFS transporter [Candidatus Avacidaminococcus intestinavium]|uniref:MFS transporter n=1 Tax=Candidatus Avacidaminococcus intestinavium TaxID=2840684 RepID=A0A9D1MPY7_9FIRM|nr:MFS transporter [Candidatus Avacidaminococcus intestinavium]